MDQTNARALHRFSGRAQLEQLMQIHELLEAFRSTHPTSREFTHIHTTRQSGARLDRWLIYRRLW
jgi:exonuclease III